MIISLVHVNEEILAMVRQQTEESIAVYQNMFDVPVELVPLVDVIIARNETFRPEVLERFTALKFLYIMSAGVDHLPFGELQARGITVCNASGIHGQQMMEHALGVMIAFSRNLAKSIRDQHRRQWDSGKEGLDELYGKTLCIVGAGRIGCEIARVAGVFGMRIIGLTRHTREVEGFEVIYPMEQLHEALGQADYVILLTPLTAETEGIMGEREFAAMKQTGIFLNLSRGETVDETALIAALKQGIIAGAGLDVFRHEPLPYESELWTLDNVIITPHSAGITRYYVQHSMKHFVRNLKQFRSGGELLSPVDLVECY